MEVLKLFLSVALTALLVAVSCLSSEYSDNVPESSDTVGSSNPPLAESETGPFLGAAEDRYVRKNIKDGDTGQSETASTLQEEENDLDEDAAGAGTETGDVQVESETGAQPDDVEGDCPSVVQRCSGDSEDAGDAKPPSRIVLQAFGPVGGNREERTDSPGDAKEEEVWTEETEDGTEQKRSGGRRFFSLMNLIKFLLNPVIEEFQEMEKSASGPGAGAGATAASSADVNNQSDVAGVSAVNTSDVGEREEKKNGTESGKKTKFQCVGRNVTENTTAAVRIVNSTVLLELLSFDKNHSSSDCVLVMFYAPWCHFCAATAPHYNAIARAFPQLEVLAVDTVHFSNLNARFGTVAVPNIMLFHQSRSAVRFNHTERRFPTLLQFITNTTGLEANSSVEVSPEDYEGPLSSTPTEETDYLLWFAWFFMVVCSGHIFISSQAGQQAIERVVVLWQEHQHQHIE